MKLLKEVCIRCINDFANKQGYPNNVWRSLDEGRWSLDIVLCPPIYTAAWELKDTKDVNNKCPKMFEHIVAAGMKDA